MVLVPAGVFLFGEKKEPVTLPAYYIDKTEVTHRAYARVLHGATRRACRADSRRTSPDLPVVNVSILDAQAFAQVGGQASSHGSRMGEGRARQRRPLFPMGQ